MIYNFWPTVYLLICKNLIPGPVNERYPNYVLEVSGVLNCTLLVLSLVFVYENYQIYYSAFFVLVYGFGIVFFIGGR